MEEKDLLKNEVEFLLQKGRCLNAAPDFSAVAEECLSCAVKLEPGLVKGWNILGEQYWKKGDLTGAKNCFTGALQQVKDTKREGCVLISVKHSFSWLIHKDKEYTGTHRLIFFSSIQIKCITHNK